MKTRIWCSLNTPYLDAFLEVALDDDFDGRNCWKKQLTYDAETRQYEGQAWLRFDGGKFERPDEPVTAELEKEYKTRLPEMIAAMVAARMRGTP